MTQGEHRASPDRGPVLGLFLIALSTLGYEILITRLFSVATWYHYAFMAISLALFGMTLGAILVHLRPERFSRRRAPDLMAQGSLAFAGAMSVGLLIHLAVPLVWHPSLGGVFAIALSVGAVGAPFVPGGVVVTLALTRYPESLPRLYGADLLGAATGCVLITVLLDVVDTPSAVLLMAAVAAAAGAVFGRRASAPVRTRRATAAALVLAAGGLLNDRLGDSGHPLLAPIWVKGQRERDLILQRWNSHSRIGIHGDPGALTPPFSWGMSSRYLPAAPIAQLRLRIDGLAESPLTRFDGDLATLGHLRHDVTNFAHFLKKNARVLVIGVGGGRDILSALVFGQSSVVGVELNADILDLLTGEYAGFTGNLHRIPQVTLVHGEGRSVASRWKDRFDLVQISLIDTWAATVAGAYVLTENALYTVEAWQVFMDALDVDGILSVSRWYARENAFEMYRLGSLARAVMAGRGIDRLQDHVVVLRRTVDPDRRDGPQGVGTFLLKKSPFTLEERGIIARQALAHGYELMVWPLGIQDPVFHGLFNEPDLERFYRRYPGSLEPPTDDRPFFFNMLRPADLIDPGFWRKILGNEGLEGAALLGIFTVLVAVLAALCIALPRRLGPVGLPAADAPVILYFAAIGVGFLLVEMAQMQRSVVFLGHPTRALSVVLGSLLLSSGLGSLAAGRLLRDRPRERARLLLVLLPAVVLLHTILAPPLFESWRSAGPLQRLAVVALTLLPVGFLMGFPLPIGYDHVTQRSGHQSAFLWGVNGATSIVGSVLALSISVMSGIRTTALAGVVAYVTAGLAHRAMVRREDRAAGAARDLIECKGESA